MTVMHPSEKTRCLSTRCLLALLSLGLICVGIGPAAAQTGTPQVVDRIVAVVNNDIVVLQDVNRELKSLETQIQTAGYSETQKRAMLSDLRARVINQLINQKLIDQQAKELEKKGMSAVTKADIDATVNRIKQQNNLTDSQLQKALKQQGLTMKSFRKQLGQQILTSRLEDYEVRSKIVITKQDVTDYYDQHADQYRGTKIYHLRNILIKISPDANDAQIAAAKKSISQIIAAFKAGESFESLAQKYSESPYASEGGELGRFELKDLSPSLRAAVAPLSPGQITAPLETSDGYQILYLQEITKKPDTPLTSVYNKIEDKLYAKAFKKKREAWIEGLRKNAHIRIIQ